MLKDAAYIFSFLFPFTGFPINDGLTFYFHIIVSSTGLRIIDQTKPFMNQTADAGSLKPYNSRLSKEEVIHLLKRTMFGAKPEYVDYGKGKKSIKLVEEMLNFTEDFPTPPVNNYNDDKYTDEEIAAGSTWITATKQSGMNVGKRKNSLKSWWTGLMINQQRSLREKMVLFWHNHFANEMNKVDNASFSYKQNMLFRQYALGNFKELVLAITTDPSMLKYLNGNNNVKKAPDENYGRELQELFTVGKGPGSHYTEDDVKAAARVLTGYRIENKILPEAYGLFDAKRHDDSDKQFSSFYNSTLIKGRKGDDGAKELNDLIDMIFAQEEVSLFICRKLYRFFVYHDIDDSTELNIIAPLAKTFRKNNFEIGPVLSQLLSSRHFFDKGNRGCMIKSPVDFCVGLCREYNVPFPDSADFVAQYALWNSIHTVANQLQQNIGDPPNVAGWQAWYQVPQFDKIWINSDTLPKRNQFTDKMTNNGYGKDKKKIIIDILSYARTFSDPGNPDVLIEEAVQRLYTIPLPEKERQYLKEGILLSGLQGMMSDHYWTDAWLQLKDETNAANLKDVTAKLKRLFQYLMNLPQYQLC